MHAVGVYTNESYNWERKEILWNVLLFLIERKYFPKTIFLYVLICIFFQKIQFYSIFTLFSLYLVGLDFCEAKLYLSPWIFEFAFVILYIEGIEVGRERERRHRTQKNISSYNFQSNLKKTFLKFLKSCRVNHVYEVFYHGTYMWKITFFNFKVTTSFKLFRSILWYSYFIV